MANWADELHLERLPPAARRGAVQGLEDAARMVLARSDMAVPVKTGALRDSGRVVIDPATLEVAIMYDTPYAVRQHEDMTAAHDSGSAKYLENARNELRPILGHVIAAHIRQSLNVR